MEGISNSQSGSRTHLDLEYSDDGDNSSTTGTYVSTKCILNSEDTIVSDPMEAHTYSDKNYTYTSTPPMQGEKFEDMSFKSVSSAEYSVDPELRLREAERMKRQPNPVITLGDGLEVNIRSVEGATIDEDYCLIDTGVESYTTDTNPTVVLGGLDLGAIASRLSLLVSTSLASVERDEGANEGGKRHGLSMTSPEYGEMTKVVLGGGEMHCVNVLVDKCGTAVCWEFSTEPKGIAFGISYKEEEEASQEVEVSVCGYIIYIKELGLVLSAV